MDCLQCGSEMKLEILENLSETKKSRSYLEKKNGRNPMSGNYYCYSCDVVFHVIMSHIYHVRNNLILKNSKWKLEKYESV